MGIPQYLMAFLLGFRVVYGICNHGKPKEDKEDGILSFVSVTIMAGILYAGGFWSQ